MKERIGELIGEKVIVKPKPAVYISGGVDSTIVLHHLSEKCKEPIYTYTAKFGIKGDEHKKAKQVSEYYGTIHKEVEIDNFVEGLYKVMKFFNQPRYNIWPYWLAKQAKKDGRETVYIGEGSDEHFGGYSNRGYIEAWAIQLMYVTSTYKTIHNHLEMDLEIPFVRLDFEETYPFYSPPKKKMLVDAYDKIIPDFLVSSPPAFVSYKELWEKEIRDYYKDFEPKTVEDIRMKLQLIATEAWLLERREND